MSGLGNVVKLIELSFKTREKYDLLVKYSLAISAFWFLTLIAPSIPYAYDMPVIGRYAAYSTKGVFLFSFRNIVLFFVPFIFGLFYLASDEFMEKHRHRAIKTRNYIDGFRILSQKYDLKSRELLLVSFAALGKGMGLVLNWIIIYVFIIFGVFLEVTSNLLGGQKRDEFFESWRFKEKDDILAQIEKMIGGEIHVYDTTEYGSAPFLIKPLLLFGKIFFGDITLATSKNVDVIISGSGIGATGHVKDVRSFYKNLIDYALTEGILCIHPITIEAELRTNDKRVEYTSIFEDEQIPIKDIKWLRIKDILDYERIKQK